MGKEQDNITVTCKICGCEFVTEKPMPTNALGSLSPREETTTDFKCPNGHEMSIQALYGVEYFIQHPPVILDKEFFLTPGRLDAFACALLETKDIDEALKASSSDKFVPSSVYLNSSDAAKVAAGLLHGKKAQSTVSERSKASGDFDILLSIGRALDVFHRARTFCGYLSKEAEIKAWREKMEKECADHGCE